MIADPVVPSSTAYAARLHLIYHELSPAPLDYSYALPVSHFETHAALVHEFHASGAGVRPEMTFDDGHASHAEYAGPILAANSLTACFFITVGWIGRKPGSMSWDQVRSLHKAGHAIGTHGWTHALLTRCSPRELERELDAARQELQGRIGTAVTTLSLPGGRYNDTVLAACREAGFSRVFSSVPCLEADPSQFLVGRLNVRSRMTVDWMREVLHPASPVLTRLERQYRVRTFLQQLLGDRLYRRLWAAFNRSPEG